MKQQFVLKRSVVFLAVITLVHIAAAGVSLTYNLSAFWHAGLIIICLASLAMCFRREYYKNVILRFNSNVMQWELLDSGSFWRKFDQVEKIYMNKWFVWIVFYTNGVSVLGVIIGRDSLPIERFMQLRRCILSPRVMHLN